MIICFSGTGNSLYCAEMIADKIGDEIINSNKIIKNNDYKTLTSQKPWIFVTPTYGWQIPHVFADFINKTKFCGSTNAYFIMTCGADIGNAGAQNEKLCSQKGLVYKGTQEVIMPENYIALFDAPNEKKALQIIRFAQSNIDSVAEIIKSDGYIPNKNISFTDKLKSGIVNRAFYAFYVKANKFTVSDACTGCGKCVSNCPLNNIMLNDTKPVWGSDCTHCMACICGCPVSAIEYGKVSVGKSRYQCPKYVSQSKE